MDKREAIELLKPFRNSMVDQHGCPISDVVFALDLAIEALKREIEYGRMVVDYTKGEALKSGDWEYTNAPTDTPTNTPTDDDTISRQAAIDAVCGDFRTLFRVGGREEVEEILKSLPPSERESEVDYCNNCPYISWGGDCISRQTAIEAIEGVDWYHVNPKGELVHGSTSDEESWYKAEDIYKAIESLPPVTHDIRTETHGVCSDCIWNTCNYNKIDWEASEDYISRQLAIKALGEEPDIAQDTDAEWAERDTWVRHIRAIESFPQVTPPKRVLAEIKIDTEELVEKIKEEYQLGQEHGRLIDADKLLQELFNVDEEEWTTPEIRAILENAPTVITPTERTGKWVNDTRYSGWTCTHCNYHDGNKTDNFCPNCGAKMEK